MARPIYATNLTSSGISLNDLSGMRIDAFGSVDLREFFTIDEIDFSNDLENAIADGYVVLNDGVKTLTLEESQNLSSVSTVYDVPANFVDLDDTPSTLSGLEDLYVRVQSTASGNRLSVDYADATYIKGVYVESSEIQDGYLLRYDAYEDHLHYESIGDILDVYGKFGANFNEFITEDPASTTDTTWYTKAILTVSGIPYGFYRIGWYYEWQMNNSNFEFKAQLLITSSGIGTGIEDTSIIMEHAERPSSATSWSSHTGFYYYNNTVSGTDIDIELQFASSSLGKTASMRRSRIEFWRVY